MDWPNLCWAMVVLVAGVCRAGPAQEPLPPPGQAALVISFAVDAEEPTLTFDRAEAPPAGVRWKKAPRGLYVLHPHGFVAGFDPVEHGDGRPAAGAPEAAAGYEVPVSDLEDLLNLHEPGTYRMYWRDRNTGERSNEVVLVRRKPGPPDPRGLPGAKHPCGTPIRAVRTFYQGVNGDLRAMSLAMFAERDDAAQQQVRSKFWKLAIHSRALREAAKNRYGTDGGDIGWYFDYTDAHLRGLDDATVTYPPYFEEAVVTPTDGVTGPIRVVRRSGQWHMPASASLRKGQPDPGIAKNIEAVRETTREITAGQHPTLRDAREAMRKRLRPGKKNKPGAEDEPARSADRVGAPDAGK